MAPKPNPRVGLLSLWSFALCIVAVDAYSSTALRTYFRGTNRFRGLLTISGQGREVGTSAVELTLALLIEIEDAAEDLSAPLQQFAHGILLHRIAMGEQGPVLFKVLGSVC